MSQWLARGADPAPRAAGDSKWNYLELFRLAIEAITSFSTRPLKLAILLGLVAAFCGGAQLIASASSASTSARPTSRANSARCTWSAMSLSPQVPKTTKGHDQELALVVLHLSSNSPSAVCFTGGLFAYCLAGIILTNLDKIGTCHFPRVASSE
jgi:di/tricarboxylate transporter